MDSVGRAKWKEFKGRRQFRVTARYANINQTVAGGTKQIPRADVGPQTCGEGPAMGTRELRPTARSNAGCGECRQPKQRWRHEVDLHGKERWGRDLNNKPGLAVLVLALKLGREFLGGFPAGARGARREELSEHGLRRGTPKPRSLARKTSHLLYCLHIQFGDFTSNGSDALSGYYGFLANETWKAGLVFFCSVCNDLSATLQSPLLWHLLLSNSCTARLENNHHQEGRLCHKKLQCRSVWLLAPVCTAGFCSHTGFITGTPQTQTPHLFLAVSIATLPKRPSPPRSLSLGTRGTKVRALGLHSYSLHEA